MSFERLPHAARMRLSAVRGPVLTRLEEAWRACTPERGLLRRNASTKAHETGGETPFRSVPVEPVLDHYRRRGWM
jgi:hypothetical protein